MASSSRSETLSGCPTPVAADDRRFGGIGRLRIVDLDNVAESNTNRQIHALDGTFGRPKVAALAQRVTAINPSCAVEPIDRWLEPDNVAELVGDSADFVVDCIDQFRAKASLAAYCVQRGTPLIAVGAAGGQVDPLRIRRSDLAHASQDPLLARVRSTLRREFGFPRASRRKFGIQCVYSEEPIRYPDGSGGVQYARPAGLPASGLGCAGAYGSVMTVTCGFAMVAVAHVLDSLAGE